MSVRPNIESLDIEGKDLVVRGQSDKPLPDILRVVVVQDGAPEEGRGSEDEHVRLKEGPAREIGTAWRATFKDTKLKKGPAETLGIEIRINPYEITSWVQRLDIE